MRVNDSESAFKRSSYSQAELSGEELNARAAPTGR